MMSIKHQLIRVELTLAEREKRRSQPAFVPPPKFEDSDGSGGSVNGLTCTNYYLDWMLCYVTSVLNITETDLLNAFRLPPLNLVSVLYFSHTLFHEARALYFVLFRNLIKWPAP